MEDRYNDRSTSLGTILAIALASIALVFSVVAYNRTGKDIEESVRDSVNTTADEAEDATEELGQGAQRATDATERAIDTGPDGVDDGAR